jgi:hypothetical protein
VSDQRDTQQSAYLDRVNSDLSLSLRRCHALLDDYRAHLVPANSNEPPFMLSEVGEKDESDA